MHMKSSVLYVGTLAMLVAGLWGILRAGSGLRAPADVSGRWRIQSGTAPGELILIRQSGRFVRLSVDGGPELELRYAEPSDAEGGAIAHLAGDGVEITLSALPPEQSAVAPEVPSPEPSAGAAPAATHLLEARGALEVLWKIRRAAAPASENQGAKH